MGRGGPVYWYGSGVLDLGSFLYDRLPTLTFGDKGDYRVGEFASLLLNGPDISDDVVIEACTRYALYRRLTILGINFDALLLRSIRGRAMLDLTEGSGRILRILNANASRKSATSVGLLGSINVTNTTNCDLLG